MARRRHEKVILFPWERRGGWFRSPWIRSIWFKLVVATVLMLWVFGARQRKTTGIRATRTTLLMVHDGIAAYRADHHQRCPESLEALKRDGYIPVDPVDAWDRPLVLTCPGRRHKESYDLVSYGPSGDNRGLDRVE